MTTRTKAELGANVASSWQRFLEVYEPHRPELFRYCRHLTRSPWDAEDMVQEALARAFVTLATLTEEPANPRAWLFRVASNVWLNRVRSRRERPLELEATEPSVEPALRATREAAGTLLTELAPQERAAVVLKDAFGLSLEEVAEALATTTGAVKAALHRGRAKLATPAVESESRAVVTPAGLDAFCAAFNARDLDGLTALLLENTVLDYPGFRLEYGAKTVRTGTLEGTLFGCPEGLHQPTEPPRCEVRAYRDEAILLWWWGAEVHAVVRVDVEGDKLARLTTYYHAPEVLTEVCHELALPFRTHGYRPRPSALPSERGET
jgi:RNA polymerase sigma-70 factor (ECF subfamily)